MVSEKTKRIQREFKRLIEDQIGDEPWEFEYNQVRRGWSFFLTAELANFICGANDISRIMGTHEGFLKTFPCPTEIHSNAINSLEILLSKLKMYKKFMCNRNIENLDYFYQQALEIGYKEAYRIINNGDNPSRIHTLKVLYQNLDEEVRNDLMDISTTPELSGTRLRYERGENEIWLQLAAKNMWETVFYNFKENSHTNS